MRRRRLVLEYLGTLEDELAVSVVKVAKMDLLNVDLACVIEDFLPGYNQIDAVGVAGVRLQEELDDV